MARTDSDLRTVISLALTMSEETGRLEFWLNGVVLFAVSLFGLAGRSRILTLDAALAKARYS